MARRDDFCSRLHAASRVIGQACAPFCRSPKRGRAFAAAMLLGLIQGLPARAHWAPGDVPWRPASPPRLAAADLGPPATPPQEAVLNPDPCALANNEGHSFLDRMQRGVYRSVCSTALWFDGLFGQELSYQEIEETYGWVRARASWDEIDRFHIAGTMRAKVNLPQAERRLNAFIGQVSEEEFQQETGRDFARLPEPFRSTRDDEWLLGLGYSPVSGSMRRFSVGVGVDLGAPPDPFVRARYRRHYFFSDSTLGRWRQLMFWRSEDGFGTTTLLDLERLIGNRSLLRWRNLATVSGTAKGVDWRTDLTLYQDLRRGGAIAYQALVDGETDAPVTVWRYGLLLNYRRRVARDWLFLEVRPAVYRRRLDRSLPRETVPQIGFGLELRFGARYLKGELTERELGERARRARTVDAGRAETSAAGRDRSDAAIEFRPACPIPGPW